MIYDICHNINTVNTVSFRVSAVSVTKSVKSVSVSVFSENWADLKASSDGAEPRTNAGSPLILPEHRLQRCPHPLPCWKGIASTTLSIGSHHTGLTWVVKYDLRHHIPIIPTHDMVCLPPVLAATACPMKEGSDSWLSTHAAFVKLFKFQSSMVCQLSTCALQT